VQRARYRQLPFSPLDSLAPLCIACRIPASASDRDQTTSLARCWARTPSPRHSGAQIGFLLPTWPQPVNEDAKTIRSGWLFVRSLEKDFHLSRPLHNLAIVRVAPLVKNCPSLIEMKFNQRSIRAPVKNEHMGESSHVRFVRVAPIPCEQTLHS